MAAELIWSLEALDDIDAIADYISRDSPWHAQAVVECLPGHGRGIAEYPQAGRIVSELGNLTYESVSSTAIAWCTRSARRQSKCLP